MSPPVTELAYLPLKAGSNVSDPNTSEGTIWQDALTTVLSQDGAQRAYWAMEIESPAVIRLGVDWESKEAHEKFIADPSYQPFLKNLGSIMDGAPALYHVPFEPHPPKLAYGGNSVYPVTEVLTMYFEPSISSEDQDTVVSNASSFTSKIGISDRNHAAGWAIEEVKSDKVEGGKAKVLVALIPWKSVEEHKQTRETDAFKENIGLLKDAKGLKHLEVYHVSAMTMEGEMGAELRGVDDVKGDAQGEVLNPQAGGQAGVKTGSGGETTKNNMDIEGEAGNSVKKERAGR